MTREEIEKLPFIIYTLLSDSVIVDTKEKLHERLTEVCNLAIKALEQEPFINKPCVSSKVCEHDKNKVLDKIRAEIEQIELLARYTRGDIKQMALNIIDKYKAESEDKR